MIEKFKEFLAGKPYKMDESAIAVLANMVEVTLPNAIRQWHDPSFTDIDSKGGEYYEAARKSLAAYGDFQKSCADAGEIGHALKLIVAFFENEARKAALAKKTKKPSKAQTTGSGSPVTPPAEPPKVLEEGEIIEMHIAKHERNAALRAACIVHFSAQHAGAVVCEACGLSFAERYGEIGEGYIEVHHLSPISQTEGTHTVDPTTDLVPLCANCHAMIHRLMTAEKKNGNNLEGPAALEKLKAVMGAHQ